MNEQMLGEGEPSRALPPDRQTQRTFSVLFYFLVFAGALLVFMPQLEKRSGFNTTILLHIRQARWLDEGTVTIFHGLYFRIINALNDLGLPREEGTAFFLAACVTIVAWQTSRYLSKRLGETYSPLSVHAIVAITLVINALYLPWLTRGVYLGQWGPNSYHSATVTTVKVFSIPVFVLLARLLREGESSGRRRFVRDLVVASVLLCVSLYAKPTLFLIMAPGALLFALVVHSRWRDRVITLTTTLTPAAIFLLYQHFAAYEVETSLFEGRWTELRPFWVWSQWTKSVPASIALTLALPAAVWWVTRPQRARDDDFSFAWALMAAGFVQAALLVEVDPTKGALRTANWFGPYLLGTHLLYIVTCAEFFAWRARLSPLERQSWRAKALMVLLALHVFCGIVYLIRLNHLGTSYA